MIHFMKKIRIKSCVYQIANNLETGKSVNSLAEINRRVDFEIAN